MVVVVVVVVVVAVVVVAVVVVVVVRSWTNERQAVETTLGIIMRESKGCWAKSVETVDTAGIAAFRLIG